MKRSLWCLLAFLCCGVGMWGQTLDNTSVSGGSSGSSLSWSHATGAGLSNSVIIVTTSLGDDSGAGLTVSAVTYNGSSLSKVVGQSDGNDDAEIWCLASPAAGSNTVSVTFTGSTIRLIKGSAVTLSGTSCTADGTITASGAATSTSVTVVAGSSSDFVIDAESSHYNNGGAETFGGGQTSLFLTASLGTLAGASYILPSSGTSTTLTVNFGNTQTFAHVAAAFKASGGGSTPTKRQHKGWQ